jgi:3-hydroxyisobutyryl-CoA hydrolase
LTGIRAVLVDRIKERPNWQPVAVEYVSYDDVISQFFKTSSKYLQNSKPLDVPEQVSTRTDMIKFGLPCEQEIQEVVTGTHKTSSSKGLDANQVMKVFQQLYPNKGGLEERVSEVLDRKCEVVDDPGHFKHVRWIHP